MNWKIVGRFSMLKYEKALKHGWLVKLVKLKEFPFPNSGPLEVRFHVRFQSFPGGPILKTNEET